MLMADIRGTRPRVMETMIKTRKRMLNGRALESIKIQNVGDVQLNVEIYRGVDTR